MSSQSSRIERELKTMQAMIRLYCRGVHQSKGGVCPDCEALQTYATQRLEKCPYGAGKATCANCPTHCYRANRRAKIRIVMRYAGPRMIYHHPILAIHHLLDGRRKEPVKAWRAKPGNDEEIA